MDSHCNEILNLAFGHYSCHIATHFFNIQEASFSFNPNFSTGIKHGCLFRESGRNNSLSPRLIAVDDYNSLGYLSKEGYYKEYSGYVENESTENNSVVLKDPCWEKNDFLQDFLKDKHRIKTDSGPCRDFLLKSYYNLDDTVASWSDYVVNEFNDKTLITLPKNTEYYENYDSFTCFDSGLSLWEKTNISDDVEEYIRFYLEECDNLQGFQMITDGGNGYSGISSGCVQLLKDEYPKKTILAMPATYLDLTKSEDLRSKYKKKCDRIYSLASSFSTYSEFCDVVSPVSHLYNPWDKDPNIRLFRNVSYKHDLMYHTSAILATALDLYTLPYRMQNSLCTMNSLFSTLNFNGRLFTVVGINSPFPVKRDEGALPAVDKVGARFFESLTPMIDLNTEFLDVQSICTKGLGKNQQNPFSKLDAVHLKGVEDNFKIYLYKLFPRVVSHFTTCQSVFRVPRTFPKVFNSHFNLVNNDHDFGPLSEYIAVGSLHNTKEMYGMLNNLYEEARTIKKKTVQGFRPRDSDIEYGELFENLKTTTHSYLDVMYS